MRKSIFSALTLSLLGFSFSGCSIVSMINANDPADPVIEDSMGWEKNGVSVVSVTSDRSTNIINRKNNHFCAGVPPETANDILKKLDLNNTLKANLEGLNPKDKASVAKANAEAITNYAKSLNMTVKQLFKPSQGLKFAQSAWYALCEANLNEAISDEDTKVIFSKIIDESAKIIKAEILAESNSTE